MRGRFPSLWTRDDPSSSAVVEPRPMSSRWTEELGQRPVSGSSRCGGHHGSLSRGFALGAVGEPPFQSLDWLDDHERPIYSNNNPHMSTSNRRGMLTLQTLPGSVLPRVVFSSPSLIFPPGPASSCCFLRGHQPPNLCCNDRSPRDQSRTGRFCLGTISS